MARRGWARLGMAGPGVAWLGGAWLGTAWLGVAWPGRARHGKAWQGKARSVTAGELVRFRPSALYKQRLLRCDHRLRCNAFAGPRYPQFTGRLKMLAMLSYILKYTCIYEHQVY